MDNRRSKLTMQSQTIKNFLKDVIMFGYTCMFWILRTYAIKLYNRTILSEQILKECLRLRGKVIFVICDLNSKEFVTKVTLVFRSLWYSETSLERLPDIFLQQLFVARRSSLWAISQDEVFFYSFQRSERWSAVTTPALRENIVSHLNHF